MEFSISFGYSEFILKLFYLMIENLTLTPLAKVACTLSTFVKELHAYVVSVSH